MTKVFHLIFIMTLISLTNAQTADWQALGEETFATCSACHQPSGEGIPGAFPSLAQHLPNVEAKITDGELLGRQYLINVVLFGVQGEIHSLGQSYHSIMPAWGDSLSDEQVAAVLNYELNSWGNEALLREDFSAITAEEVATQRATTKTSEEVYSLRAVLALTDEE